MGIFKKYIPEWKGKDILDIGSGDGWLLEEAKRTGAKSILGIEPSEKNRKLAADRHPSVKILPNTLENFESNGKKFSFILSIMSLPHIKDLDEAYKKMGTLLEHEGELITVVPDFDYFKTPRHGYKVQVEILNSDEYIISTTRPTGTLADIVRKDGLYIKAAEKAGFKFLEQVPMIPQADYLSKVPEKKFFPNTALCQLLRFHKA